MSKTYKDRKTTGEPRIKKLREFTGAGPDPFQELQTEYDEMYEDDDYEPEQPDSEDDL